jgi:hypothetical protein
MTSSTTRTPPRMMIVLASSILLLAAVLSACSDPVGPPDLPPPTEPIASCAGLRDGQVHREVGTSETWRRADGPHVLEDSVRGGTLTIEAGSLVCGMAGSVLAVTNVIANGTPDAPISFVPADSAGTWDGIDPPFEGGQLVLVHVRIRSTAGRAVRVRRGTIRNSLIERACRTPGDFCAAVEVHPYASARIDSTTIRDSGGGGIFVWRRSTLRMDGGSIEGSQGTGLDVVNDVGGTPHVEFGAPVRITGGAGRPAQLTFAAAATLTRDSAAVAGLLGNQLDELVVIARSGWGDDGSVQEATIRAELPWLVRTGCAGAAVGTLRLRAGARLRIDDIDCTLGLYARIEADATAAAPAVVSGGGQTVVARGEADDTLRLRHVRFEDIDLNVVSSAAVVEHAAFLSSALHLNGAGSRIVDSAIDGPAAEIRFSPHTAALTLGPASRLERTRVQRGAGDGVVIAGAGVTLQDCTIAGHAGDGVRVETGSATIAGCNIEDNAGAGVRNEGGPAVDARFNWWGDPEGPTGSGGDGVAGAVTYEPFRSAPLAHGTGVASIRITPAAASVGTADAVELRATAYDAAGGVLPAEEVVWRSDDPALAVEGDRPGWFVGRSAGTARIVASARSDEAVTATATLEVIPAAPFFAWDRTSLDADLRTLWRSPEGHLFAGGLNGVVYRYDGSAWNPLPINTDALVVGIGGTASDDVYAATRDASGTGAVYYFDGDRWSLEYSAPGALYEVQVKAGQLVVAGETGVLHRTPTGWEHLLEIGALDVLVRPDGHIFATVQSRVGDDYEQRILRFDGSAWHDTGASRAYRLWGVGDEVYSIADGVHRYVADGTWEAVGSGQPENIVAVSGTPNDFLALTKNGTAHHFDGSDWRPVHTGWPPIGFVNAEPAWRTQDEVFIVAESIVLRGRREGR